MSPRSSVREMFTPMGDGSGRYVCDVCKLSGVVGTVAAWKKHATRCAALQHAFAAAAAAAAAAVAEAPAPRALGIDAAIAALGDNQEDAIVVNRAALERGAFGSTQLARPADAASGGAPAGAARFLAGRFVPEVGDKLSSRHGQKCVIGRVIADEDIGA